jgi:hypothetical protein
LKAYRIISADPIRYPVLRITFDDGYAGDYDLGTLIASGPLFEKLKDPEFFKNVAVAEDGRGFGWDLDVLGREIDFCPDATRITLETNHVSALADEYERQRPAAE